MKTKAAILVESKKPLEIAEIELPDELFFGQVLVQVHYSGICGAQINEIEAAKGVDKFLPHLLGHEGSATVLDVGPGVKTVKKGDLVVMHWRPSDGLQSESPTYHWGGKKVNAGWVTTFNEHAVVSENRLTPIPNDFDLKLAPLFGCAVTTAMGVINNDAQVKIGQSVVIFGVGGVGLNIVQSANLVSAYPIIGIDINDSKVEMALKWGASHAFNSSNVPDIRTEIISIVGSQGADIVIDTTGNARIIEMAYELTHPQGKTIIVGVMPKTEKACINTLPLHFGKILTGSHGGECVPNVDIPRYIRLHKAGKLHLDGLVTHQFTLDEINTALDVVRSRQAGRVILACSKNINE